LWLAAGQDQFTDRSILTGVGMIERASSFVLERQVGDPQLGEENAWLAKWNSSLIKNVRNAKKFL
jgi:hypothetical protein